MKTSAWGSGSPVRWITGMSLQSAQELQEGIKMGFKQHLANVDVNHKSIPISHNLHKNLPSFV